MIDLNRIDLARGSAILYHGTSVGNVLAIVQGRKFKLSSVAGVKSDADINDGYDFYLSCSRSKKGGYSIYAYSFGAMLVLNGDWFSQRYRVRPVDYWGPGWNKDEMEDRVMSNKPEIDLPADLSKVIKAVHIYIDATEDHPYQLGVLRRCLLALKLAKVKGYVYMNKAAFQRQDVRKAKPVAELADKLRGTKDLKGNRGGRKWLAPYMELLHKKKYSELSEDGAYVGNRIVYYSYNDEALRRLENDLHNEKTSDAGRRFVAELRKRKLTPATFIDAMVEKWTPLFKNRE